MAKKVPRYIPCVVFWLVAFLICLPYAFVIGFFKTIGISFGAIPTVILYSLLVIPLMRWWISKYKLSRDYKQAIDAEKTERFFTENRKSLTNDRMNEIMDSLFSDVNKRTEE